MNRAGAVRSDASYSRSAWSGLPTSSSRSASCSRAGRMAPGVTGCLSVESSSAAAERISASASSSWRLGAREPGDRGATLDLDLGRPVESLAALELLLDGGEGVDRGAGARQLAGARRADGAREMDDGLGVGIVAPRVARRAHGQRGRFLPGPALQREARGDRRERIAGCKRGNIEARDPGHRIDERACLGRPVRSAGSAYSR